MNLIDFAQFGAAIVAIAALAYVVTFVVKKFLDFLQKQEDNFTMIITNHLTHSNKTNEELKNSNLQLKNVIERLLEFLKNGKH